jgi:hypothetical protein
MTGLFLSCALALAGPVGDGADAFEDGRLDEAVAIWEEAMGGAPSGVLLYNLGTAWYRKGDPPRAVAYLRAAQRLRPRDGSVHHNLALARSELDRVPPPAEGPVAWSLVVTPGELGLLAVLLTGLGSLLLAGGVRQRSWTGAGAASWGLGIALGSVASIGAYRLEAHPIGVVVDAPVALRDAASLQGRPRHDLPVGSEVRVERRYGGFLLVEDGRGRRGWVPDGGVVVPVGREGS